jgi:stage II sporulation protein E
VAATLIWEFLYLPDTGKILIGILEGVFVYGVVYVCTRLLGMFLDWEPHMQSQEQAYMPGGEKLSEYAQSFEKLSNSFRQMNRYKDDFTAEELNRIQGEVTGRICVSCNQCAICWENEETPMYQVLYRFLQSLQRGGQVNENKGELSQYCPYTEELVEQVLLVFEKAHLNMAWYNRLQENRDAIAQQLNAMAYIMEDCAKQDRDITGEEGRVAAQIKYALKERGIVVEQLRILEMRGEKLKIQFGGRTKGSKCISVREMAKIISKITGRSFSPSKDSKALLGEASVSIAFLENCRLTAYYGVARAVREDQKVSGDNFSFQMLDGGKCVMSVSDGMGSGYGACKESEMVIDLIEKFMEAGFLPEMALRMMNSAMVTHGDNNLFSTVDLMYLDLDSGDAQFYKIGAVATFIRGKDGVRCVDCISMPVGVFAGQKVPICEEKLESGEFVVMVTDGVLEHLPTEHAKETVMEIIRGVETNNPAEFSRAVLDQVLLFTGGRVRDDMTVLTAGIWNK